MTDHRFRRIAATLLAAAVCSLVGALNAYAAPEHGSGTAQVTGETVTSIRQAGENTIITIHGDLAVGGVISGPAELVQRIVVHPDGTGTFYGSWTCACSVDGHSGTVVTRFAGRTVGDHFGGTLTTDGSGGLEGFQGHGTFEGTESTGASTYAIDYHLG